MNWLVRIFRGGLSKLGLIITLLALILYSCEDPNNIGEELISGDDTVGVVAVDWPVISGVILNDSLVVYHTNFQRSSSLLFGQFTDPVFGSIYAESYSGIIPVNVRQIPNIYVATYDSITIKLKVDYRYGTDGVSPQDLKIYQLNDTIHWLKIVDNDTSINNHYTHNKLEYNRLLADTSLDVQALSPYKADSMFFNIKLDDAFGQEIFNKALTDSLSFTSYNSLNGFLKGLAFVPGNNNNAIFGLNVSPVSSVYNSLITLHYHTDADTLAYSFYLSEPRYSYIETDRSGTELAGLTKEEIFYPPSGKLYGQAGTGIVSYIDFSSIKELKESVGNMVINNAMLYMEVEGYNEFLSPPLELSIYVADSLGKPVSQTANDTTFYFYSVSSLSGGQVSFLGPQPNGSIPAPYAVNFNNKKMYMLELTLFLQSIINGTLPYDKLVFYPYLSMTQRKEVTTRARTDRFVVNPEKVRLRIYYTTLN